MFQPQSEYSQHETSNVLLFGGLNVAICWVCLSRAESGESIADSLRSTWDPLAPCLEEPAAFLVVPTMGSRWVGQEKAPKMEIW